MNCSRKASPTSRPTDRSTYKIAAFPAYGALSRIKERELKATIIGADDDHKDDASDFALWKAYKPDEDGAVKWPGPRGAAEGRPGWHIECSAMSRKHLGDTIDLHAGGVDLLFPHHENEIAQSEGCTGHPFSRHWYHSEFLLVDGKKMSKSLGNLYTLSDLTAKGFSPMAVRYALLSGHPRKQLNFSINSLTAATEALRRIKKHRATLMEHTEGTAAKEKMGPFDDLRNPFRAAFDALSDDLFTPDAFGVIFQEIDTYSRVRHRPESIASIVDSFDKLMWVLGLDLSQIEKPIVAAPSSIVALAGKRWAAKQAKDFKTADALRKELAAAGWTMLDGKDGYKLEPLKKA